MTDELKTALPVKQLEWEKTVDRVNCGYQREQWAGRCPDGSYYLVWNYDNYHLKSEKWSGDKPYHLTAGTFPGGSHYSSLEDAKAAAQADYERRILSAIEPIGVEEAVIAGWNACRKSIYAVCEDVEREAKKYGDLNPQYEYGMQRAAKSIARGFGAMEALDDDYTQAALRALTGKE